uniref:Secreted protein n=1 Tax=Knipowitschia caucasica TaxID=637954 RepID=A0AAV2K7A3_KNICA
MLTRLQVMQCLVPLLTIFPAIILVHLLPITCSTMALRYTSFQLHRLTHCLPPPSDIAASIKHAALRVIRTHVKLT